MTTVGLGNTLETLQDASFHEPSPRSEVIVFDSRQPDKNMREERPKSISRSRSRGHKSKQQFLDYQSQWLKVRDAKIEQARIAATAPKQQKLVSENSEQYLPKGYKGPIRGYYEQVGRYFELKQLQRQLKAISEQPPGRPSILNFALTDESYETTLVEDRLMKKGLEYRSNRA